MKKIYFYEYNYVLNKYPVEMLVSDKDYKKYEKNKMSFENLVEKAKEIDYGISEPIYDNTYLDEDEPYEFDFVEDIEN